MVDFIGIFIFILIDLTVAYKQYAWIWAEKYTPETIKYLLLSDVHSPAEVRVNAVLSTMPEFYEIFDVVPGDEIYKAPKERVKNW